MNGHDHGSMGHGGMNHGGMEMPSKGAMCNMNVVTPSGSPSIDYIPIAYHSHQMLFTWDTTNLCIVFRQWHIYSTFGLIASLFGVVLLTAGYELVREASRRYEASSAEYMNKLPSMSRLLRSDSNPVFMKRRD